MTIIFGHKECSLVQLSNLKISSKTSRTTREKKKRKGRAENRKDVLCATFGRTGLEGESERVNKGQRKDMTVTCVSVL